ncbi:class I SAM-dependent methyltransferase [Candidatus Pacearchaeota archaeon]|nr:class I SAM-dependent methyltransferase [Candidatus Pacearchaeota archaeon]
MTARANKTIKILSQLDSIKEGAEIGVWRGNTSMLLLRAFSELKLHLIDPYKKETLFGGLPKIMSVDEALKEAKTKLNSYKDRCIWHRMVSQKASYSIKNKSLDFVFIDGDHSFLAVKKDIKHYLKKIRPGGVMLGHDWRASRLNKGVQRAVHKMFPEERICFCKGISNLWWVFID